MNQSQQTFIVTGATSGIGLEITRGLLQANKSVIMIVRSASLAEQKIKVFKQQFPHCNISYLIADLSSQKQVEAVAENLLKSCRQIDGLINNAGVCMTKHHLSVDDIELTFAVNHMSHFILTNLLLERLRQSESARIVILGSNAHTFVNDIRFDDIGWKQKFRPLKVYGQSKLSNILFMRHLSKQLPPNITVNAADPGAVATRIGCNNGRLERFVSALCRPFFRPIPKGAETPLYLALSPEVTGNTGFIYKDKHPINPSPTGQSDQLAEQLWDYSLQLWKNASLLNGCHNEEKQSIVEA